MGDPLIGHVVRFTVLGVPASWERVISRRMRGGELRPVNSDDYKRARKNVATAMLVAAGPHAAAFRRSRLSLRLELYYPDRRVRDADRALNLVLDAGKGILWDDDAWTRFEDGALIVLPYLTEPGVPPRMHVHVSCIGPLRVGEPSKPNKRARTR